jgi:hypothetical protein
MPHGPRTRHDSGRAQQPGFTESDEHRQRKRGERKTDSAADEQNSTRSAK